MFPVVRSRVRRSSSARTVSSSACHEQVCPANVGRSGEGLLPGRTMRSGSTPSSALSQYATDSRDGSPASSIGAVPPSAAGSGSWEVWLS